MIKDKKIYMGCETESFIIYAFKWAIDFERIGTMFCNNFSLEIERERKASRKSIFYDWLKIYNFAEKWWFMQLKLRIICGFYNFIALKAKTSANKRQ